MSTAEVLSAPADLANRGEFEYRALNIGAVASLVFGLLSAMVLFAGRDTFESAVLLTPLPLIGIVLGVRALQRIKDNPEQYSGRTPAVAGVVLSAAFLLGGLAFAGYVRATEVPDGYARTSFADFKPDEIDVRGSHIVPPDVAALDGQKVFIKGYIRPDSTNNGLRFNIKKFLLVRDNNQCCFGDMSAVQYFDQMEVRLKGDLTVDYSPGLFRMGGTLRVDPRNAAYGSGKTVYRLEADHAE